MTARAVVDHEEIVAAVVRLVEAGVQLQCIEPLLRLRARCRRERWREYFDSDLAYYRAVFARYLVATGLLSDTP